MAQRLAYLEAVIGADVTQFRKGMRDVRSDIGGLSAVSRGIASTAQTLTYAVSAPLAALSSYGVNLASDFDASMRNINAIARLSETDLATLSNEVLDFGAKTRSGALETSEALYTVFSAGIEDSEEAFATMQASVATSEAGLADLTTTTEAIVASFLAFDKGGRTTNEMLDHLSDSLTQMVNVGVGSMDDFAGALGNVIPSAAVLNMEVEELYGNLAFLTQRGLSPAKAATSLNAALTSLAKPTDAMNEAFKKLGADGIEDLIQQTGGVNAALRSLIETTDGTQKELQAMFNNIRGSRAINYFIQDLDEWENYIVKFGEKASGATMLAQEQQMKSFSAQVDTTISALKAMGIAFGEQLFPYILPVLSSLQEFGLSVLELEPEVLAAAAAVTVFAIAFPPLIWGITSLISPIGLLVGALGLLSGISVEKVTGIEGIFTDISNQILGEGNLDKLGAAIADAVGIQLPGIKVAAEDAATDITTSAGIVIDSRDILKIKNKSGVAVSAWSLYESNELSKLLPWTDFLKAIFPDGKYGAIDAGTELSIVFDGIKWELATSMDYSTLSPDNFVRYMQMGVSDISELMGDVIIDPQKVIKIKNKSGRDMSLYEIYSSGNMRDIIGWHDLLDVMFPDGKHTAIPAGTDLIIAFDGIKWSFVGGVSYSPPTEVGDLYGYVTDMVGDGIEDSMPTSLAEIPGAEEEVEKLGDILSDIFSNALTWAATKGVPKLAYGAGYLAATTVGVIGKALGFVFDTLSGVSTSEDGFGDYFYSNITTPFNEGMDDALGNLGIDNPGEIIIVKLAASLGAAVIGSTALTAAFKTLILGSLGAVNFITLGIGPMIIAGIKSAIALAIGTSAVPTVAAGGGGAFLAGSMAGTGARVLPGMIARGAGGVGVALAGAHVLSSEVERLAAEQGLDKYRDDPGHFLSNTGLAGAFFNPSYAHDSGGTYQRISNPDELMDEMFYGDPNMDFQSLMKMSAGDDPYKTMGWTEHGFKKLLETSGINPFGAFNPTMDELTNTIIGTYKSPTGKTFPVGSRPTDDVTKAFDQLTRLNDMANMVFKSLPRTQGEIGPGDTAEQIKKRAEQYNALRTSMELIMVNTDWDFSDYQGDLVNMIGTHGFDLSTATTDEPVSLFLQDLQEYMNTGGVLPGFEQVQGTGSTAGITIPISIVEGEKSRQTRSALTTFPLDMAKDFPFLASTTATSYKTMGIEADKYKGKTTGILNNIKEIIKLQKIMSGEDKETILQGGGLPAHQSGLDYVPYDDYAALLHKGEMVLTANEANLLRKGGKGGSTVINNVYIYGVQDISTLLEEFNRNDINLEGYNRYEYT